MFAARVLPARLPTFTAYCRPLLHSSPFTPTLNRHLLQRRTQYRISYPGGGRGGGKYNRFQRPQDLKALWQRSPAFRYGVLGSGGALGLGYYWNLERVPVTGRSRFNIYSAQTEEGMAKQMYDQMLKQFGNRILPAGHPDTRMVQRVLDRLIPASGLEEAKWEVHVVRDPEQMNAVVIPGGKVFVFSGILPICGGEDGLAAVLGHEIAHNVAHHAAERMSSSVLVLFAIYAAAFLFGAPEGLSQAALDLIFSRPGSRKQEAEADYIGLLMMAQSCYDPRAAVGLWARMEKAEQFSPPQWLSTHPSSHQRMEKIREWLPEAEQKQNESDCQSTLGYAREFKETFNQVIW
ncbi:MAG: hypothetical protein M1817_001336 [Caeruleum heppii]|nr:MAG: hypothetical protein M1817_001336 [Caeruleum heppii]